MVQFVISELGQRRSRDNLVRMLCEQHGWPWKQTERFVRHVEIKHHDKIIARQSPLVIALGVGSVVVGAAMAIYTAIVLIGWISNLEGTDPAIVENMIYYAFGFVAGLAILVGGVAGIWRTVSLMQE